MTITFPTHKPCNKCKVTRPLTDYYFVSKDDKSRIGICVFCRREANTRYNRSQPPKTPEQLAKRTSRQSVWQKSRRKKYRALEAWVVELELVIERAGI